MTVAFSPLVRALMAAAFWPAALFAAPAALVPSVAGAQASDQASGQSASAPSEDASERPAAPPAVSYVVVDGVGVADPLAGTSQPDPERGADVFFSEERGNCVACHRLGDKGAETAPALDGVGVRLAVGALRLWIMNPAALKDVPGKPAYFSIGDPPPDAPTPRTRLTAQEIEDLAAFLSGLR